MKSKELIHHKIGNIYQYSPEHEKFACQYIVATEIKSWGIQGYLLLDQLDNGSLTRYKGRAFARPKYEDIVCVGFAEWLIGEINEVD